MSAPVHRVNTSHLKGHAMPTCRTNPHRSLGEHFTDWSCAMTTDPYSFALEVDGWNGPQHPTDTSDLPPECPACGEPIDYCQGHGEIGDPLGADILRRHDGDDHSHCLTICD